MKTISLINDFTDAPGGRYKWQGDFSGEQFRVDLLQPLLEAGETVEVNLNGAIGLPSSFLDEAFGPLFSHFKKGSLKIVLTDNAQAQYNLDQAFKTHR